MNYFHVQSACNIWVICSEDQEQEKAKMAKMALAKRRDFLASKRLFKEYN